MVMNLEERKKYISRKKERKKERERERKKEREKERKQSDQNKLQTSIDPYLHSQGQCAWPYV